MARWTIYDKNGNVKAITNGITVGSRTMPELEYSGTWMGETFVTISVKSEQPVNWQIGDYLIYRGEKFVLNYDPSVVKKARRNTYGEGFVYDGVKFNSLNVEMSDVQFLDEVLSDNHIHYTSLPAFSFFAATIDDYADRLQANMNRYCLQNNFVLSEWWLILTPSRTRTVARGAGISGLSTRLGAAWDIAYQDEPSTDGEKFNQNVSISKSTVFAGLANIYNLFGLHYVTSGRTLIIGAAGKIASHVFEYGKGNGLYEIERVADSEQQLVTKLYAYGNSTNLPIRYYSNIAKVCVGKVTGIQRTGNTQLSLDTDLPYQDSYFSNRTGDIIPRALVTIRSHVITIGGGVIKRDNNTVMVSIFLKTSPDDPDWYTTDSQGLATLIQQMQVGDELIFVEGADIDKWPAGHFSYGSAIPNNLAINNLMLPGFPTQSLKAWVLANGGTLNQDGTVTWNGHTAFFSTNELAPYILSPNSAALGVREASKTWDGSDDTEDIYPTIENTGDDILVSADIITDNGVFGEGEEVPNFSVIVKGLGDDVELDSLISNSGDAAKISIKDGYCGGREFSVVSAEKVSGSTNWKLTLKRDYDEALQLYFPYSNNASIGQTPVANEAYQLRGADIAGYDGDKFVWLGIDMPSEYIEASAEKLLDAALTFLEANDYARYTYSPKVDEIYMAKQHDAAVASQSSQNPFDSLHDTLHEGNLMQFDDEDLLIDGNIFIDKLTIKEYGNGAIPTYDVTLRNHKSVGTYQRLLNTVDSLSGKGGASGIWGNGGVSTSQTKDLIKQEGDKRYIRRDINDETNTELTANKFIAKEGVKTDNISPKTTGHPVTMQGSVEVTGDFEVDDDSTFDGTVNVSTKIQSPNFNEGLLGGTGWAIWKDALSGLTTAEVDMLNVRMKAVFAELEVKKYTYSGGNIIYSDAGNKVLLVLPMDASGQVITGSGSTVAYRCCWLANDGEFDVKNDWAVGDQARCQTNNLTNGTHQNVSNRYYWRKVLAKGDKWTYNGKDYNYVDLAASASGTYQGTPFTNGCQSGVTNDVPAYGDSIVQMGHQGSDAHRQNLIILVVNGDDAPAIYKYQGVNDYTLDGKMIQGDFFDPTTHTFKTVTYGDMYVGEKSMSGGSVVDPWNQNANPNSFMRFTEAKNGNPARLDIKARVDIQPQSTIDTSVIQDNVNIGRANLLLNTSFRGQYNSVALAQGTVMADDLELWSPSLEGWTHENAVVDDDADSASTKSCELTSGYISQEMLTPIVTGAHYIFTLKAKGTSLTIRYGSHDVETISLTGSYDTYTISFDAEENTRTFKVSGTGTICELALEKGNVLLTTWEPSPYDNDSSLEAFASLKYLTDAMANASTSVIGGLVLSNIIELGNYVNGVMQQVTAGMSGVYNDNNDVAFFGGGTLAQAIAAVNLFRANPNYQPTAQEWAAVANAVITHGGRAILNDAIFRGSVYAENGYFKGELKAARGTFDGYVKENFIKIEESDAELHTDGSAPYNRYYTINTNVNLEVKQGQTGTVVIPEDNVKLPSDISYIGTHIRLYNAGWGVYGTQIAGEFPTIVSDYDILGVSFAMTSGGMLSFPDKITFGGGLIELIGVKGDDNGTSICQWVVTNIQCRYFVPQKTQGEPRRTLTCGDAIITFGANEIDIKAYDDINQQNESAFVKLSYGTAQGRTIIGYEVGTTAARIEIASNGEIIATNGVDTPTVIVPARNS